ncbi:hypothetical protein C6P41_002954 [Kluyveromyces marxianus]|nr:hypothetical protein C6P43_003735 [Kluyveromyces marxianus]KAG0683657.1 hypothetical protein C6P41_002954 [Kluyveromyces marxianus]
MTNNMEVTRPKRSTTANVDYDLKKRRIIPSEDRPRRAVSNVSLNSNDNTTSEFAGPVISKDENGNIRFQEPPVHDPVNGMTGSPLSQRPKRASNSDSNNTSATNITNTDTVETPDGNKPVEGSVEGNNGSSSSVEKPKKRKYTKKNKTDVYDALRSKMKDMYEQNLQTNKSNELTKPSDIRSHAHSPSNDNDTASSPQKKNLNQEEGTDVDGLSSDTMRASESASSDFNKAVAMKIVKRMKSIKDKDTKLFGQNDKASHLHIPEIDPDNNKENDDFCSTCHGSGVFLCCDTCPKSFHFACCNPPLDPSNLPEGDWSCDECKFKQLLKSKKNGMLSEKKQRSKFLSEHSKDPGYQLFGALVFDLKRKNPSQFQLPSLIKSTFESVYSGPQGEYRDEHFKENINEKQIFHSAYGQSVTRLDSYQPEHHMKPDTEELLLCYHCGESRMGTWDHPDSQRLIMTCDYCSTPWHLDCLPYPRASLKNLGSKWKCPLHAPLPKSYKRRLARGKQKYILLPVGSKNYGDVEILLDRDSWVVPKVNEQSVALQFLDKVYQAKRVQKYNELYEHSVILDKLMNGEDSNPLLKDLSNLLYFQSSGDLKRLWDFKELCKISEQQLQKEEPKDISEDAEMELLKKLKKLLESKPKEEVIDFFKLDQ